MAGKEVNAGCTAAAKRLRQGWAVHLACPKTPRPRNQIKRPYLSIRQCVNFWRQWQAGSPPYLEAAAWRRLLLLQDTQEKAVDFTGAAGATLSRSL